MSSGKAGEFQPGKDADSIGCLSSGAGRLAEAGEHALALEKYNQLFAAGGESPDTHHGVGRVLYRLGEADAALRHLESAAEAGHASGSWIGLATMIPGAPSATPEKIREVRIKASRRLRPLGPIPKDPRPPSRWNGRRPLRVGFLSAFFHQPNYMKPVWGLLNTLPRDEVELHLFSDAPEGEGWRGYSRQGQDRIHPTSSMDNPTLARLIRTEELDVLVDLNAYSSPERLPLFLESQAPLVLAWFNAYATTGLPGIDGIVGDHQVVLPGEENHFTEKVMRLPGSYLAFQVPYPTPGVAGPPCRTHGCITFGSLAPQYKITPPVLDDWAEILLRVPDSRLFLANTSTRSIHNRAWILERFVERGIRTGRIVFGDPAPHQRFLEHYARIDIALDTYPYSGGVTTMEALWQGVPVLALEGDRWAARTSRSILRAADLGGWVVRDRNELVERAVELGTDPKTPTTIADIRSTMRERLQGSAACDTSAVARALLNLLHRELRRSREVG